MIFSLLCSCATLCFSDTNVLWNICSSPTQMFFLDTFVLFRYKCSFLHLLVGTQRRYLQGPTQMFFLDTNVLFGHICDLYAQRFFFVTFVYTNHKGAFKTRLEFSYSYSWDCVNLRCLYRPYIQIYGQNNPDKEHCVFGRTRCQTF